MSYWTTLKCNASFLYLTVGYLLWVNFQCLLGYCYFSAWSVHKEATWCGLFVIWHEVWIIKICKSISDTKTQYFVFPKKKKYFLYNKVKLELTTFLKYLLKKKFGGISLSWPNNPFEGKFFILGIFFFIS